MYHLGRKVHASASLVLKMGYQSETGLKLGRDHVNKSSTYMGLEGYVIEELETLINLKL